MFYVCDSLLRVAVALLSMSRNGTLRPLPVLIAHLCSIKSMRLKVLSELDVFFLDSVLVDLWQAPDEESRQEAER